MAKKKQLKITRGGRRPGAGRKPMKPEEKMISISFALPRDLLDRIDDRKHVEGLGRSELLRRYAEEGLAKKPKPRKKKGLTASCRKVPPIPT